MTAIYLLEAESTGRRSRRTFVPFNENESYMELLDSFMNIKWITTNVSVASLKTRLDHLSVTKCVVPMKLRSTGKFRKFISFIEARGASPYRSNDETHVENVPRLLDFGHRL
jgi:hypothetical protein